MKKLFFNSPPWWLCLLSLLTLFLCRPSIADDQLVSAPAQDQEHSLARAYRHEKHGWIYLHVEGSAKERGFQHGYLLAKEIAEGIRVTKALWERDSSMDWPWLLKQTSKFLEQKTDPENLAEIDGIVEGLTAANISSSRAEMLAYNAWIELDGYWWPKEKKKLTETE